MPDILSMKSLIAKIIGTISAVSSGLPLGPEGPLIHIGANVGAIVIRRLRKIRERLARSRHHPFTHNSFDSDERDYVGIGAGCGISSAFSAPLGALLFIVEEASSFFDLTMVWRAFVGVVFSWWISAILKVVARTYSVLSQKSTNPLCNHNQLNASSIFFFMLIGIMGGLLGAFFNWAVAKLHKKVWSMKSLSSSAIKKVLATCGFAIFVAWIHIYLPALFPCEKLDSSIFLKYPNMCMSLRNERQLYAGMAFVSGTGIPQNVLSSQEECLKYSSNTTIQSILEESYLREKEVNLMYNDESHNEAVTRLLWGDWDGTTGTEALGHVLPLPKPLVYNHSLPVSVSWAVQHTCPTGYFNAMASLLVNPLSKSIRLLFLRGAPTILPPSVLIMFVLVYMAITILGTVMFIPGGLFIPQMLIGAAYGRLVGFLDIYWEKSFCGKWSFLPALGLSSTEGHTPSCLQICQTTSDPTVYAVVGAASFLGGTGRTILFLVAVMLELTQDYALITPITIGLALSVWIGNFFNMGIYHMLIHLRGFPYLPTNPGLAPEKMVVSKVMSSPVVTIPRKITVNALSTFLEMETRTHHGFPVIAAQEDPKMVGFITKDRLERLLAKRQAQTETASPALYHEFIDDSDMGFPTPRSPNSGKEFAMKNLRSPVSVASIKFETMEIGGNGISRQVSLAPESPTMNPFPLTVSTNSGEWIDLSDHMELSPTTITEGWNLGRAYHLFRRNGLRHLVVVNGDFHPVGMLTRKDLLPHVMEEKAKSQVVRDVEGSMFRNRKRAGADTSNEGKVEKDVEVASLADLL